MRKLRLQTGLLGKHRMVSGTFKKQMIRAACASTTAVGLSLGVAGAEGGGPPAAVETTARPMSPNLYYVDVAKSGTMCLYNLEQVRLWRPFNEGIVTYTVSDPASDMSVDVTFDDGESVAPLDPALMALREGRAYTIAGPEGSDPATITFANLGQQIRNPSDLATALVDKGCMDQVTLMGEKL